MSTYPSTALATIAGVLSIGLVVGCGDERSGGSETAVLSPAAERGRVIAESSGCVSCHGATWSGGVGPSWIDLAGSTVVLSDGTTVTADTDYLTKAITTPAAQQVQGYTVVMPSNALTSAEVADVVAFIEALSPTPPQTPT